MESKIVPPFKLDDDNDISDGKGRFTLFIEDFPFDFDVERRDAFARELCAVMNENHKRLCHAANGEDASVALYASCLGCRHYVIDGDHTTCDVKSVNEDGYCEYYDEANGEEVRDGK